MNKIELNKNNIIGKYDEGAESIIYYYKYGNYIVLLKYLKTEIYFNGSRKSISSNIIENKRKKIDIIANSDIFKDEIQILDLVYENGIFIGYTMKISNLKCADINLPLKEKINILRLLRDKVEMLNKNDIYIGDFKRENILVGKGYIKLCDLDNIKINGYDFDLKSSFEIEFEKSCSNMKNSDNYCFNMFTISYIGNIYAPYVKYYIKYEGLPKKLDNKKNRKILNSLISVNDDYKKQYLIDNI